MEDNVILCGDCVEILRDFPENHFDATVFSPPYDNMREYRGYAFDLPSLGEALYRVTKEGGIVAMVIQDQTLNGRKSLTSFRAIVDWCDRVGFHLFECLIYQKNGKDGAWWRRRFRVDHEYIPVFVKGERPKIFDKSGIKIPCKHAGKFMRGGANRNKNGETVASASMIINDTKCPGTIWDCANGGDKVHLKRRHPAPFPDKIPYQLIQAFTQKGDLVLDPMVGSGSTAVAAAALQRRYIGIDISDEYCALARKRIEERQSNLFFDFKNPTR